MALAAILVHPCAKVLRLRRRPARIVVYFVRWFTSSLFFYWDNWDAG
ncbi:hypothetical protein [Propionivibrio sp.]